MKTCRSLGDLLDSAFHGIGPPVIFRFGPYAVDGGTFELTRDGRAVPVEPQVLSVILYLLNQRDHVVSRDELVDAVWNGRAISDAAIASRIKSARHVLGDNGSVQAVIRTIHGRGFRFVAPVSEVETDDARRDAGPAAILPEHRPAGRFDRRVLLASGAAGAAALAGAGTLLWRDRPVDAVPPEVADLVFRAREGMNQNTRAGQFQAIGIFRRVVEMMPDYADGWGMLGMAYGIPSHYTERAQALDLRHRGEAAARRALALERGNGYGELALGILTPFVGHYWSRREYMRRAVAALPGNSEALTYQAVAMQFDGYPAASVGVYEKISEKPMSPALYNNYIRGLWSAGRMEEADRALGDALALYPTQATLWFTRLNILQYAGRTGEALAMIEDRSGWPAAFGDDYAPVLLSQTRALETREPALVRALVEDQRKEARQQAYQAEGAIRMMAALDEVDEAFAIADAYFFGHGFTVPDYADFGSASSPEQRQTRWLFEPVTAPMRADPRFEPLVAKLGFDDYWRRVGVAPDYRRAARV